jgi:2,3-bisphosphoglycerate-dependent phosphoglycerate mutase
LSSGDAVIALVRHGSYRQPAATPSAHLPYPLDEGGRAQALAAADPILEAVDLLGCRLDPIIDASPLLRAWETAGLLAGELSARTGREFRVETFPALSERGLGDAANLTMDQIEDILREDPRFEPPPAGWKSSPDYRLPFAGAESLLEAGRRAGAHLEARARRSGTVDSGPTLRIMAGHGGAFRFAAVHLGLLSPREARDLSMHHARPVFLVRSAAGSWRHVAGAWKVRRQAARP